MGGKQKQAQRTKGNTRPSNSGKSAEKLLASGAAGTSTFLGFSGFGNIQNERLGLLKTASDTSSNVDPLIDGDCRMLMKRMTKKDAITRLKALQEFQSWCLNCSEESLLGALPFWPRLFNKLCLDLDRRVREAAHNSNNQVVLRAKRNMAPHIKGMMGNWLLGQCDPYAPAASAAKLSFNSAFSQEKQLEAIVFCKENILNVIGDYLFNASPQTLSDCEVTPIEQVEEMYNRVLSSTLMSLGLFINQLPPSEQEKLIECYAKIINEGKFWKISKSPVPQVRAAWFGVISTMCERIPFIWADHLPKLCPAVLGKLDESDPIVVSSIWDAALHILVAFQDCWKHVNVQKAVLPKLWTILRKGCDGNARSVGPYLLPLLSQMPAEVCSTTNGFYGEFFTNLRHGLVMEKVQNSSTEREALVTAYLECFKFVITETSVKLSSGATAIAEEFLLLHLLPVVESSIVEESSLLSQTTLYSQLGQLLRHISYRSLSAEHPSTTFFRNLENCFWNAFDHLCLTCVENMDLSVLRNLCALLSAMGREETPGRMTRKKKSKVRFSDEPPPETPPSVRDESSAIDAKISLTPESAVLPTIDLSPHLSGCAFKLCAVALRKYNHENSIPHLRFLVEMSALFSSPELFKMLLHTTMASNTAEEQECVGFQFYENVLHAWLMAENDADAISDLTGLLVVVFRCIGSRGTQLKMLKKLGEIGDARVLLSAVSKFLDVGDGHEDTIKTWFKDPDFGDVVLKRTRTVLRPEPCCDETAVWELLGICIAPPNDRDGPIIAPECFVDVLNEIFSALPDSDVKIRDVLADESGTFRLSRICGLVSLFYNRASLCWTFFESHRLLFAIFKLGHLFSTSVRSAENATLDSEVDSCWKAGVRSLVKYQGGLIVPGKFLHLAATFIHDSVLLHKDPMRHLTSTMEFTRQFLDSVKNSDDKKSHVGEELLGIILPSALEWTEMLEDLCQRGLVGHFLWGELYFQDLPPESCRASKPGTSIDHQLACSLLAAHLSDYSDLSGNLVDDEERHELACLHHLVGILNTMTFCKQSCDSDVSGKNLRQWADVLQNQFIELIKQAETAGHLSQLRDLCYERAQNAGTLYSYSLRKLLEIVGPKADDVDAFIRESETSSCIHVFQVLMPMRKNQDLAPLIQWVDEGEFDDPKRLAVACTYLDNLGSLDKNGEEIVTRIVDELMRFKETRADVFLFARELPSDEWRPLCHNIQLAKLMTTLLSVHYDVLRPEHWDFIMCSLGSWLKSCHQSCRAMNEKLQYQAFANAVYRLMAASTDIVHRAVKEADANRITEWNEFFAESFYNILLDLFCNYAGTSCPKFPIDGVLGNLVATLKWIPSNSIVNNDLPPCLVARWDENDISTPVKVKTALNFLSPLLLSPIQNLQLGAYAILHNLVAVLPRYAIEEEPQDEGENDDETNSMPGAFMAVLATSGAAVEAVLRQAEFGEAHPVTSGTESHSLICGYLYCASLMLRLFANMTPEMRSSKAGCLRNSGFVHTLLRNLFCLMPANPSLSQNAVATSQKKNPSRAPPTVFSELVLPASNSTYAEASSFGLQQLACFVYYEVVRRMPALVREWWHGLDRRSSNLADRFTAKYVSPLLCSEDIGAVQNERVKSSKMSVRARPTAREVVATYAVEDISFELVVRLAENHPLGAVTIETGRRIGVKPQQWRDWLLQMTTFLMHQNGSILDGLILWKRNIDKKFEGVEECYVCFYIVHGTTYHLPTKICRTCKKKFHSDCLYKWFTTSGHSTCPLCRSMW